MSDEATAFDDGDSLDLFWHALSYRTASTEHADGCWLELEKCVGRMVAQSRLAAMAHAEAVIRGRMLYADYHEEDYSPTGAAETELERCAHAIRREREGENESQ